MQLAGTCHSPSGQSVGSAVVLGCIQALEDDKRLYIVSPYFEDVAALSGHMDENDARIAFRSALQGLRHFHSLGLCHGHISSASLVHFGITPSIAHAQDTEEQQRQNPHQKSKLKPDPPTLAIAILDQCSRIPYALPSHIHPHLSSNIYPISSQDQPQHHAFVTDVSAGTLRRLMLTQARINYMPFMPPELHFRTRDGSPDVDGPAIDLWSAAVLLYSMITGTLPHDHTIAYAAKKDHRHMKQILDLLPHSQVQGTGCCDLLQWMFHPDPKERPSMAQILDHPWLRHDHTSDPQQAIFNNTFNVLDDFIDDFINGNVSFDLDDIHLNDIHNDSPDLPHHHDHHDTAHHHTDDQPSTSMSTRHSPLTIPMPSSINSATPLPLDDHGQLFQNDSDDSDEEDESYLKSFVQFAFPTIPSSSSNAPSNTTTTTTTQDLPFSDTMHLQTSNDILNSTPNFSQPPPPTTTTQEQQNTFIPVFQEQESLDDDDDNEEIQSYFSTFIDPALQPGKLVAHTVTIGDEDHHHHHHHHQEQQQEHHQHQEQQQEPTESPSQHPVAEAQQHPEAAPPPPLLLNIPTSFARSIEPIIPQTPKPKSGRRRSSSTAETARTSSSNGEEQKSSSSSSSSEDYSLMNHNIINTTKNSHLHCSSSNGDNGIAPMISPSSFLVPPEDLYQEGSLIRQSDIHDNDVLFARGGFGNNHPGNGYWRKKCKEVRPKFVQSLKFEKRSIAEKIVRDILSLNPPGRFLQKKTTASIEEGDKIIVSNNRQDGKNKKGEEEGGNAQQLWVIVSQRKAEDKTLQRLRDGAPGLRGEIGGTFEGTGAKRTTQTTEQQKQQKQTTMMEASIVSPSSTPPPPPTSHHRSLIPSPSSMPLPLAYPPILENPLYAAPNSCLEDDDKEGQQQQHRRQRIA